MFLPNGSLIQCVNAPIIASDVLAHAVLVG